MRFISNPVEIDAVQFHLHEYADNPLTFDELPDWLSKAIENKKIVPVFKTEDYWYLVIKTLEGDMLASPGDWIVKGLEGEFYPCKDSVFKRKYKPLE